MAKASQMLTSLWKGDKEQWVLAWYRRNDRPVIKGQVFHLPKASYVSHLSTWGWVGRDPEPQVQGLLAFSDLRACLHLAPGLWLMGGRTGSWEVCLLPGEEASVLVPFTWGKGRFQCCEASVWITPDTCRGGVMPVYWHALEGWSGQVGNLFWFPHDSVV